MPIVTRSQTRSGQPPDLETSPGACPPRRFLRSRQGNAGVIMNIYNDAASPHSVIMAHGNGVANRLKAQACRSPRCKTCSIIQWSSEFKSNVTNKKYTVINNTNEMLNCHSQNIIYLITCKGCNIQYVGETVTRLSERMNVHRTSKTGCEHVIEHHKSCKSTFNVQILEKLPGTGYNPEGDVDPDMRDKRLEREDYWIKTLRVIYPYGLNEKAKCKISKNTGVIGTLYPPLPRTGIRPKRSRVNRNNHESILSSEAFFREMKNLLQNNIKQSLNEIRKLLDKIKKKELKKIATAILDQNSSDIYEIKYEQCYQYVLDVIDTN